MEAMVEMNKVIEFDKLLVKKNELFVDSPFTDFFVAVGKNEKEEQLGTLKDKVEEIYLDIKDTEFPPDFVHLVLRNWNERKTRVMLYVGNAGYVWVPKHGLRMPDNEELTERARNIAKGLAHQSNYFIKYNAELAEADTYEIYDIDTVEVDIRRDYDGELYLRWNAEMIKVNNNKGENDGQ